MPDLIVGVAVSDKPVQAVNCGKWTKSIELENR